MGDHIFVHVEDLMYICSFEGLLYDTNVDTFIKIIIIIIIIIII